MYGRKSDAKLKLIKELYLFFKISEEEFCEREEMSVKLYSVKDSEFSDFGKVLEGYCYDELNDLMVLTEIPEKGIIYQASYDKLEQTEAAKQMCLRGFGGYPIQLGYVNGRNRVMNCLEYHKSSEFNIALNDMILVLGKEQDIADGKVDSALCKAFFVPAGTGVELYGTTLHYAPFNVDPKGYRAVCVLPKGTNAKKKDFSIQSDEDRFCFGVNKWLLAHPDAPEVKEGARVGINGANITFSMLEE